MLATPGLTALKDPAEARRVLLDDALAGLELVRRFDGPIVDVGSGGGTPGIPLAASLPDREVTLLEAERRKTEFLERWTAELPNLRVVWGRAEEQAPEQFGVAVAKALAQPPVAAEWCLPLVEEGGAVVLWVGPSADLAAVGVVAGKIAGELEESPRGFLVHPEDRPDAARVPAPRRCGEEAPPRLAELLEQRQLQAGGTFEARVQRAPRCLGRCRHDLGARCGEPRGRIARVVHLEREADVAGDTAADLDLVDERGVLGLEQLERRAAGLEDGDAAAAGEGGHLLQPEHVAIEAEGLVVVLGGDADAQLADAHGASIGAAFRSRMPLNSSVEAATSFQSGQRFGRTRNSISARSCRPTRSVSGSTSSGSTAVPLTQ